MKDADGKLLLIVNCDTSVDIGDPAWDHKILLSRGAVVRAVFLDDLRKEDRRDSYWITAQKLDGGPTFMIQASKVRQLRTLEALAAQAVDWG